ncbi:hypothetical protein [Thorsellia kenyensis]|uniref:Uncharacterized protein n=1 Tax=Thorsellia kenyensis TaxID=1549888 RepID=A0ABV6CAM3_9GAMM
MSGSQVFWGVTCATSITFNPEYRYQHINLDHFLINEPIDEPIDEYIELGSFIGWTPYRLVVEENKYLPKDLTFKFYCKDSDGVPIYLE